jgi:sugar O-acyltransferase (sialic acid O-acetyltransferase NeuD family)
MQTKVIIFGSSYQANVIFSELQRFKEFKVIGFCDDKIPTNKLINTKYKLKNLGKFREVSKKINDNVKGIIGIGENKLRKKIVKECYIIKKKFKWINLISKNAIIDKNVTIGEGSVVLSGSVIRNDVKIGNHCLINSSCSIDHDTIISDFASCGPGVIMGGNVFLGNSSFIGIGSTVKHSIKMDQNVFIGGHSYVNKDCKKGFLYYGSPIKKISKKKF